MSRACVVGPVGKGLFSATAAGLVFLGLGLTCSLHGKALAVRKLNKESDGSQVQIFLDILSVQ